MKLYKTSSFSGLATVTLHRPHPDRAAYHERHFYGGGGLVHHDMVSGWAPVEDDPRFLSLPGPAVMICASFRQLRSDPGGGSDDVCSGQNLPRWAPKLARAGKNMVLELTAAAQYREKSIKQWPPLKMWSMLQKFHTLVEAPCLSR